MLIDDYLPRYQFSERHALRVRAPRERVWEAIPRADLGRSPVVRLLLTLRGLSRATTLADFHDRGFTKLAEDSPRELLIGLEGPFWKPNCRLRTLTPASFGEPQPEGTARAVWNFAVEEEGEGVCLLTTETRIALVDAASRRKFGAYWFVIRPGSGLIRRFMLRAIRAEAEGERR